MVTFTRVFPANPTIFYEFGKQQNDKLQAKQWVQHVRMFKHWTRVSNSLELQKQHTVKRSEDRSDSTDTAQRMRKTTRKMMSLPTLPIAELFRRYFPRFDPQAVTDLLCKICMGSSRKDLDVRHSTNV